jgi:glucan phosphoethanolaminetransferase (alkaline phosphatase superfamily)
MNSRIFLALKFIFENFPKHLKKSSYFWFYSIFLTLIYNTYIFAGNSEDILLSSIIIALLNLGVFTPITLFSILSYLIFPLINICCGIAQYFYITFNVPLRYKSISWVLEANKFEIVSYLSPTLICIVGGSAFLGIIQAYLSRHLRQLPFTERLTVVLLAVCISIGSYEGITRVLKVTGKVETARIVSLSKISPVSIVKAMQLYQKEEKKAEKLLALPAATDVESTLQFDEKPIIVFVIGESARAGNFSLNGYVRETNPLLKKEQGLINFGIATSFATSTRRSLIGMLTNATRSNKKPTLGSFITFFNKHHYNTYFYSLQNRLGRSGHLTDTLISSAKTVKYMQGQDPSLLPVLEAIVAQNSSSNGSLILLHTKGSHFSYRANYTDEFRTFLPDQYTNEQYKEDITPFINAYDNTIVKTDWVLTQAIDILRDKNAVLVYTSDHGENLGEDGVMFHGGTHPIQSEVPFMIWLSDKYKKSHPEIANGLTTAPKNSISHDNLYHTIVGLGGIKSPSLDASLDLTHVN